MNTSDVLESAKYIASAIIGESLDGVNDSPLLDKDNDSNSDSVESILREDKFYNNEDNGGRIITEQEQIEQTAHLINVASTIIIIVIFSFFFFMAFIIIVMQWYERKK